MATYSLQLYYRVVPIILLPWNSYSIIIKIKITTIRHSPMSTTSQSIVSHIITHLLQQTWLGVAEHSVHRMMPTNVRLMNVYTFQSLAELNSELLQASDGVAGVGDRQSLGRDNLLGSFIRVEKGSKCVTQGTELLTNNSMLSTGKAGTRFKINKSSSKNSNNTSKIATQRNKEQTSAFKILEMQGEDQLLQTVTPGVKNRIDDLAAHIEHMRERIVVAEEINRKEVQELQIRERAKLEKQEQLRKKKKQIDKFTYDYDGDFFGSKVPNPENTLGAAAKIRLELQKQGGKNSKKIERKKPLFTTIINEKLEERYKRIATQQQESEKYQDMFKETLAARFANSFSHDDDLSQGISIKETTSNFSKMRPLNRLGQKLTLSQFKSEITNKRFKEFRLAKPLKNTDNLNKILKNKLVSHKSQQNFIQNKNPHLASSQLDAISQKNKRYRTMFRSEQSSILDNSQLSRKSGQLGSGIASHLKKGKIKISNPSLYDDVLRGDEEEEGRYSYV